MARQILKPLTIILALQLTACLAVSANESQTRLQQGLKGHILVWHSWEGEEHKIFKELLNKFTELYPDITIAEETYPLEYIEDTFSYEVEAGLGPDILIAPANLTESLASHQLIRNISDQDIDLDIYLTTAVDMLRNEDKIYGLPLSLNTFALYYNKALLARPLAAESARGRLVASAEGESGIITRTEVFSAPNEARTEIKTSQIEIDQLALPAHLDDLLKQTNSGQSVAIRTDFYGAFWGVQAFGGQLFDDKGRVVLNQGGFINWLGWLKQAQANSSIILNRNDDVLSQLFASGKVAYYVGTAHELPAFQAALGEDNVGVVRLPARQNMPAGPFLQTEALMFSSVSAPESADVALQLAQYLTNVEQQRRLALAVGKLPANKRVKIDPRVSPILAEFIAQSRTAVPVSLKNIKKLNDVIGYGDDLYSQVLEGETDVAEAATLLTRQINQKYGLDTIALTQSGNCEVRGDVILWNTWSGDRRDALKKIQENFIKLCPNTLITMIDVDPDDFSERYRDAIETGETPDIFTGTNQQLSQLGQKELVLNLSDKIDADFLQRFLPPLEQAVRYQENIYGIPVSANVMALYYNTGLVGDPPVVLSDLLIAATPEQQVAIPIGFEEGFWGITAFGESGNSALFDDERRLMIGDVGFLDWLSWLKSVQNQPGIVLSTDTTELQTLFLEEQAAFLVGDTSLRASLETMLGAEKIGVVPLPSGSPLLEVDTLFISPLTDPDERAVALEFTQFITDIESQLILLEETHRIPANININIVEDPITDGFIQQAMAATVMPNVPEADAVFEWGDQVYEQILENEISPTDAARNFANVVNATNGFEISERAVTSECTEEEEISLWHSWTEVEQIAWQIVISDFVEICPNVQIMTTFIPADEFGRQLTATLEAETSLAPPDFFLASHAQLEIYHTAELVQDITTLVKTEMLVDYIPKTAASFSLDDQLYGLPQSLELPVLYYHRDTVAEPAQTFQELLNQAQEGASVAIKTDFVNLFWGASAFGCQPCQTGELFSEQDELLVNGFDVSGWQAWLRDAARTENFIFGDDQTELEEMFLEGDVAYLVAGPGFLNDAQAALGIANVGLGKLPLGRGQRVSKPFLQVDGFFFYQKTTEEQTRLALQFAKFASLETNQTLLMQKANLVPVSSLAIARTYDPAMLTFISGIEQSILLPRQSKLELLEEAVFDDLLRALDGDITVR